MPFVMTVFTLSCFAAEAENNRGVSAAMPSSSKCCGKPDHRHHRGLKKRVSFPAFLRRHTCYCHQGCLLFYSAFPSGFHLFINMSCEPFKDTSESAFAPVFNSWSTFETLAASQSPAELSEAGLVSITKTVSNDKNIYPLCND